jgi:integrase
MAESLTRVRIEKFVSIGPRAGKSEAVLWDSAVTGLGLRVRVTGSTAWVFVYRPKGAGRSEAARKVTLGSWPTLAIDAARAAAKAKAGEVALGADPAAVLREERNRERRMVSKALDEYESAIRRRKLVNVATIMSTLRRGLAPLAGREIDTLTRVDLVGRIEALEDAGLPGAAADLRKHSRSWLEWAVSRGLAPFNALAGLRRPRESRAERLENERKGRALSDKEFATLWAGVDAMGAFGGLVRFALLTGLRRSELAGLRWSDIKADRLTLAAHGTKTGVAHEVPLTVMMRNVLTAQPRTASDLVFGSARGGVQMSGWTKLVGAANARSGVSFKLHDLRRTTRTLLSRLGVDEPTAELCIGHVRRGLVATYNKDSAWSARADAFERVSAHVAHLVSGGAPETDEDEGDPRVVVALGAKR